MGRPEKPLDPASSPVAQFAYDLRALKKASGLSYRAMAGSAHYGATTLSEAASGKQLPSLELTLAYIKACEADEAAVSEWRDRWYRISGKEPPDGPGTLKMTGSNITVRQSIHSHRKFGSVVGVILLVVAAAAFALGRATDRGDPAGQQPEQHRTYLYDVVSFDPEVTKGTAVLAGATFNKSFIVDATCHAEWIEFTMNGDDGMTYVLNATIGIPDNVADGNARYEVNVNGNTITEGSISKKTGPVQVAIVVTKGDKVQMGGSAVGDGNCPGAILAIASPYLRLVNGFSTSTW